MKFADINWIKLIGLLLALVLCLSAVGCGGSKDTESGDTDTVEDSDDVTESEEGDETEEPPRFDGPTLSVGDSVTLGSYYSANTTEKSALKWTVLKVEKHRALLIADKCIDHVPFEKTAYKVGTTITWETSSIREWLNNDFYNAAFSDDDKTQILNGGAEDTVAITTKANILTDLGACADTYDKVFLPSADEVEALFEDDSDRVSKATAYAMIRGARIEGNTASWWLRTMGETYDRAAVVLHDGEISYTGYNVNFGSAAVRPCIWIATNTDYKQENPVVSLNKAAVGSRVEFGSYEQDGNAENGKEAIVWKVVDTDGDKLLLVAENVLEMQKFYAVRNNTNWKSSNVRQWVNGNFLTGSFTEEEAAKIVEIEVKTSANPQTGTAGGETTTDKLFVLSIDEILKYFPEQADRMAAATAHAAANGVSVDPNFGTSGYWTRTMGETAKEAAYVYYYGDISYNGAVVRTDYLGVRPAVWVSVG